MMSTSAVVLTAAYNAITMEIAADGPQYAISYVKSSSTASDIVQ
jgi:hypothetical protein